MFRCLLSGLIIWLMGCFSLAKGADLVGKVTAIPKGLAVHSFYTKYVDASGIVVVAPGMVQDQALLRAKLILETMLSKCPEVARQLVSIGSRIMIVPASGQVCDLPEYAFMCRDSTQTAYWNRRARGFGGGLQDPNASCGEENLLCLPGDRYEGENILIHEFAHLIHQAGILPVNPGFREDLRKAYQHAKDSQLWERTYAMENESEYFAEAVQSFFNANRYSETPNGIHNNVNRREKLKAYDPVIYELLLRYFPEDAPNIICNIVHP